MIVSWNWLQEYVDLNMSHDDLVDRLTMSGLNHESTDPQGADQAIDLEVTSNRPDCLGHIGVAREIAVLYEQPLKLPEVEFTTSKESIEDHCEVEIQSPETCFRYTARLIKGVKIGPSPQWLQDRLSAIGIGVVNNVVDVTNYVMMECGQPLHAFDFAKVADGKIIVRSAHQKESFEAIDHRTYELVPGMCVIADAKDPVALGGVMGGAESEVSDSTTDILIEAAYFDQLAVRKAARRLKLHSPSSFRFERDIDSAVLDWASRRACSLIQQLGGGEVLDGFIDVGQQPVERETITLRFGQIERLLGIKIPDEFSKSALERLGLEVVSVNDQSLEVRPPSWRKDLTREVDLIEEVGRIYGFDQIPDNVNVPMAASHRPKIDRLVTRLQQVMLSVGFDEAVTPSLVPEPWSVAFSPWSDKTPMVSSQPMLGVLEEYSKNIGAVNLLRRSLVPSLLEVRRINEYRNNPDAALFETACVYLTKEAQELPDQPLKLSCVTGDDYYHVKGVIEMLLDEVDPNLSLSVEPCEFDLLDRTKSGELKIGDSTLGWLGEVSKSATKTFGLRSRATVAEIDVALLERLMVEIPQHRQLSPFPAVTRDFNFVVDNEVHWAQLESTVRNAGGDLLESVCYRETFRNEKKDGPGKKRVLMSVTLRSGSTTLTGEQADQQCGKIVDDCRSKLNAVLLG
ncbi:MAG: phenylalanine--tRNA ligase subunit beta [Planctomycetota bacterium]